MILLRRHQKKGGRAGPRGRPELSTSVLVQRSQTVLISLVGNDTHDILLLRLGGPDATGKGDLLGRDPAVTEVGRGNGDAPVQGRSSTSQGFDPVVLRPPEDLRHRTGEGGQVGRRGPIPYRAQREATLLRRVRGPLPVVVGHLNAQNKLPSLPNSSVMDGRLLRRHQFAYEDVLRATHRRVTQQGLGELDAQPVVLELAEPGGVRSVSEISSCFFGPRPWHIEIRHRVQKIYTIIFFGFEILKLKIRRLKLWKPTVGRELDGRPRQLVVRGGSLGRVLPGDAVVCEVSLEAFKHGHTPRVPASQREVRIQREDLSLPGVQL